MLMVELFLLTVYFLMEPYNHKGYNFQIQPNVIMTIQLAILVGLHWVKMLEFKQTLQVAMINHQKQLDSLLNCCSYTKNCMDFDIFGGPVILINQRLTGISITRKKIKQSTSVTLRLYRGTVDLSLNVVLFPCHAIRLRI